MSPPLGALRDRDPAAWNALYDELMPSVYSVVFHLARADRRLAEELHQEIWLAALDGITRFDPARGDIRSWLLGIARKRVALHYRRTMGRGIDLPDVERQSIDTEESGTILPDDLVEQLERASVVRASLAALDDQRRDVLLGKYVEGLSIAELSARTGKTPKAIESLLSRAREELRSLLAWYFQPESEGKSS
jgi:RNA polymerase sigma-70 factor (ECF subfamily)